MKVLVGILFTLAAAAYWLFERDRAVDLIASLVARPRRKKLRDTWDLIEQKLGAFIRGQLLMITIVSTLRLARLPRRSASRTGCCSGSRPASSRSSRWSARSWRSFSRSAPG